MINILLVRLKSRLTVVVVFCRQACVVYNVIMAGRSTEDGDKLFIPPILYQEKGEAVYRDKSLNMAMSFPGGSGVTRLKFVVSSFSLDGRWLGYSDLDTLLFYCGMPAPKTAEGGGTSSPTRWQRFGFSEAFEYRCSTTSLLEAELRFYELFIEDQVRRRRASVHYCWRNFDITNKLLLCCARTTRVCPELERPISCACSNHGLVRPGQASKSAPRIAKLEGRRVCAKVSFVRP